MIAEFVSNHPWMTFFIVCFLITAVFKITYNICITVITLNGFKRGYTTEEITSLVGKEKTNKKTCDK